MTVQENYSLREHNTFGLDVQAKYFVRVASVEELQELIQTPLFKENKHLLLGGGSNLLLRENFEGLVIQIGILGISSKKALAAGSTDKKEAKSSANQKATSAKYPKASVGVKLQASHVIVKAMAGENWHHFVLFCIEKNWAGIENLSLIPGCVGAAPMQNIGAYGVEIKDVFHQLEAINLKTGEIEIFDAAACKFGYRESIFKKSAKGRYCILSLSLRLTESAYAAVNVTYGAIGSTLENMGISDPGIREVSQAVIKIRSSKLPDPAKIGNAGSFFKNPELPLEDFERLQLEAPSIPYYPLPGDKVKVPAGWLIEQCGWKGKRVGQTGAHAKQALVLVNYGKAKGDEIWEHAMRIQKSVMENFGIELQPEVNVI